MKKIIAVFWCASLLFLTACQKPAGMPTDNEFHAETDCQYSLAGSMEGMQFAESDNGYYTLFAFFLMFIDGETITVTPLCSKPNCLHEKETDIDRRMECEAYLPYATGLYYQNHTLYVLTSGLEMGQFITELTSMNPDGSSRKTLLHFDSGNISHAFIHRGWLYYAGTAYFELRGIPV